MRLTALLLIVAAFARPFLWRPDAATAIGPGAREVVVLLDQSYSMAYGDRWDRAKAAARDAINRLGPSDRGSVVLFSLGRGHRAPLDGRDGSADCIDSRPRRRRRRPRASVPP